MDLKKSGIPPRIPSLLTWLLAMLFPVLLHHYWGWIVSTRPHGIRLFFDHWDLTYYFTSGVWAVGPRRLFVNAGAEYPLLANLLFGGVRLASSLTPLLSSPFDGFAWLWMSITWFLYVVALRLVYTSLGRRSILIWLAPATLYFALLRYDLYPALACLLALMDFRKERWIRGAVWFGVCIAFKGYALFLLPPLFVFLVNRVGMKRACMLAMVALAPFVLGHLIVYRLAGMNGVVAPYRFHLRRRLTDESTYTAVVFVGEMLGLPANVRQGFIGVCSQGVIPIALQVCSAVAAAASRPRTFEELVHALLFAVVGFVSFAVFWSEQFILWIAAIACFSSRRVVLVATSVMCWVTILEFPVLFDLWTEHQREWQGVMYRREWQTVLAVTSVLRLVIMTSAVPWGRPRRARESLGLREEDGSD